VDSGTLELAGEIIGGVAAFLTTVSFLPQFLKARKTNSTKDISLGMLLLMALGILCWLAYGLYIGSKQIIIANIVTLALALGILYYKLKYGMGR
jgi:MtN3 and saliva related transmembrane protein